MSQSSLHPQEVLTYNQQVSRVKASLDTFEILHGIGEWILVDEWASVKGRDIVSYWQFRPQTILNCRLVSKFWCHVFTPLWWSVCETRRMKTVPRKLLTKYSDHVRILDYLAETLYQESPIQTHLRHLVIETGSHCCHKGHQESLRRLIGANMNLVKLRLVHVELFKRDASEHEGSNENDNKDADDIHDDHTLCLTNPLGHLKASLLELSMKQMGFEEKEFYYALRDIAGGSLRTLKLGWIVGSLDLHGLVFESLTRLHLWLRRTMKTDMFEIIGRSPHLDHLELYDAVDPDDWFQGGYVLCDLEPLAQFLRGTPTMDPSTSGSTHRQWTRPQLATLRLHIRHMVTQSSGVTTGGNNPQYLELIRACSNTYDKFKRRGYLGSLRELVFSVHNLDDDVREVIEIQGEHLEVLRIAVISNFDPRCERIGSIINHSLALAKIFQSCRRLKEFEYESWYSDADIRTMMEILIEKIPEASWDCRDLESLQLYSSGASFSTRPEEERWFVVAENTKDNNNHVHGSGTWRMPSFKWDPKVNDGTAFLLDAVEGGTGRSKDGEELIRRFLRHISPSKKLKNLQLAQLKFVRPCACMLCSEQWRSLTNTDGINTDWMVAFDGLDC